MVVVRAVLEPSSAGNKAAGREISGDNGTQSPHCCHAPLHPWSTAGRSAKRQSHSQGRQSGDRRHASPGQSKERRSRELGHPLAPCGNSWLGPPRDWESRGPRDSSEVRRIWWEVAGADPLKLPRQAPGEPEETQQNSTLHRSAAASVVKPDPGKAARAAVWGEGPRGQPKGQHTGPTGQESPAPPSPARTRLDEPLCLGDGAVCRAVG